MSGDQFASAAFIALVLLLVLSSLVSRRIPGGVYLRNGLIWALIITVVTAVIWLLGLK